MSFEKCFNVLKVVWKCFWNVCVCLKISKDFLQIDQVTRIYLPTQKSFLCIFIPLTLLIYHCFGKQPYLWMLNGTGVGHRMTMIAMLPSILAFFRDKDHLFRQPSYSVIEGLWSYNCFVLPRYFACIPWPFLFRQPSGWNPKGAYVQCVSYYMHLFVLY